MLKYLSKRNDNALTNDFINIFIILINISSWPWVLYLHHIILSFLVFHQDWIRLNAVLIALGKIDSLEELFFKRVHCSAKKLLNKFAFVFVSVTNLSFIKSGGISKISCYYRMF